MKKILPLLFLFLAITWGRSVSAQAYSFVAGQLTYTETFDAMGSAGTNFLPGWTGIRFAGTGTVGAVLTMAVTDGSATSGNVYNVGASASEERAFGTLGSGTTVPQFGASFFNNTGSGIVQVSLTGVMEQWRSGSNATANETVIFEYSLDATDLTTGTWAPLTTFDLVEKLTGSATAAAVDGNLTENKTAISGTIASISWAPGASMWIRWTDANDFGSDAILAIDDFNMTVTTGTVVTKPEPTNYPTVLSGHGPGLNINTTWTDATGAQLPDGYLVKISSTDNITTPVDGTYTNDELDLSDGKASKNVLQGVQQYSFNGLSEGTTYYIKIFPYTNGGSLVDYKTDGTIPSVSAKTQVILNRQNFETSLTPWTQFSSAGEQTWVVDSIHGIDGTRCIKMTGFVDTTSTIANNDWLISPSISIPGGSEPVIEFVSAMKFGTGIEGIEIFASNDYEGGDPETNGSWTDLTDQAVFSAGNWAWQNSGFVDLSAFTGINFHIAFRYTCGTANAPTWELDNIVLTNNTGVGMKENTISRNTSIGPNPCSDWFSIQCKQTSNWNVNVYNVVGKLVLSTKATSSEHISVSGLSTGLYSVILTNPANHIQETHKLIVE